MLRWATASFTITHCQEMVSVFVARKKFKFVRFWKRKLFAYFLFFCVLLYHSGVAEKHADNYEEDYLTDLLGR